MVDVAKGVGNDGRTAEVIPVEVIGKVGHLSSVVGDGTLQVGQAVGIAERLIQTVDEVGLLGSALRRIVLRDIACDEWRARQCDTAVAVIRQQAVVASEQGGHALTVHIDMLGVAVAVVDDVILTRVEVVVHHRRGVLLLRVHQQFYAVLAVSVGAQTVGIVDIGRQVVVIMIDPCQTVFLVPAVPVHIVLIRHVSLAVVVVWDGLS